MATRNGTELHEDGIVYIASPGRLDNDNPFSPRARFVPLSSILEHVPRLLFGCRAPTAAAAVVDMAAATPKPTPTATSNNDLYFHTPKHALQHHQETNYHALKTKTRHSEES